MQVSKFITTALLLVSLLPWCGLTTAAAAAGAMSDADANLEVVAVNGTPLTEAMLDVPPKKKRTAVLHLAQCSAYAPQTATEQPFLSGIEGLQLSFGVTLLIPQGAQAPPITPPRSV